MNPLRTAALVAALLLATAACGSDESPEGYDGILDCEGVAWSVDYESQPGAEGTLTPYDAMVGWADGAYRDYDQVHVVSSRTATVVVGGMEIAFVTVFELPSEAYAVDNTKGCGGFEPGQ